MVHSSNAEQSSQSGQFSSLDNLLAPSQQEVSLLISHELRTPLTSIQGVLRLLHKGHLDLFSEDGQRLLAMAINNTNRLTRLANAIEHEPVLSMNLLSPSEVELLQLENALYSAFEHQEFDLAYQPIVSVDTNEVVGFEALARWNHAIRGAISPMVFIPLAEKTGLIHSLGLWIIRQACQQLYDWQQLYPSASPLTISVNLSTIQLLQPNLAQSIRQILQDIPIAPNSLKLEITESALIDNQAMAIATLNDLQELGIQFYIDDFGTGYSSLARLQDLPVATLKIDRSFIQNRKWDISETILLLASRLKLEVIAEGIETLEDLVSLKQLGCKNMQGYFFSKPVDALTATAFLNSFTP